MKSLFFTLACLLILGLLFREPPVGETVTIAKLQSAAELSMRYPSESSPFSTKIKNSTLTNGDFVQLEEAVKPAKDREAASEAQQLHNVSPVSWWLLYDFGWFKLGAPMILLVAASSVVKQWMWARG